MAYFTHDNTEGYDDADLALLNRAWESLPISVADDTDIAVKSTQDHIAGELLHRYDNGMRGEDLVASYYAA
jgi:hypothetical protein